MESASSFQKISDMAVVHDIVTQKKIFWLDVKIAILPKRAKLDCCVFSRFFLACPKRPILTVGCPKPQTTKKVSKIEFERLGIADGYLWNSITKTKLDTLTCLCKPIIKQFNKGNKQISLSSIYKVQYYNTISCVYTEKLNSLSQAS